MSAESNIALVGRYVNEFANKAAYDIASEIFAEEFLYHRPNGELLRGRDQYVQAVRPVRDAFPDWNATIENIVAQGDLVSDRVRVTATFTVATTGRPPTGESFDEEGMHLWRIEEGRIAEGWLFVTPRFLAFMMQASLPNDS